MTAPLAWLSQGVVVTVFGSKASTVGRNEVACARSGEQPAVQGTLVTSGAQIQVVGIHIGAGPRAWLSQGRGVVVKVLGSKTSTKGAYAYICCLECYLLLGHPIFTSLRLS